MSKVQYLRVILTEKCNLNCFFCHREGCEKNDYSISKEEMYEYISMLIRQGIRKIKLMGGEPTLYPNLVEMIKKLKKIDSRLDISIITNGIAKKQIYNQIIEAGIDRINVSLHGYNTELFTSITRGTERQLIQMFESIDYLKAKKVLGKINYVVLKDINEHEFFEVLEYVHINNVVLDVLNYLGEDFKEVKKFHYDFLEIEGMIKERYNITHTINYRNPFSIDSKRLFLENGGIINLKINKLRDISFLKACKSCEKRNICEEGISAIRLTKNGVIQPCLFRDDLSFDLHAIRKKNSKEMCEKMLRNYLLEL